MAKSKKQEKVYEDALEQLQAELDSLEAENATLRKGQGTGGGDRSALPAAHAQGAPEPIILGSAGLETAQLMDQVRLTFLPKLTIPDRVSPIRPSLYSFRKRVATVKRPVRRSAAAATVVAPIRSLGCT